MTDVDAAPSSSEEAVLIGSYDGEDPLPIGSTGSFVDVARLDQDSIEIVHHSTTDGAQEVKATFKTFRDDREPTVPIYQPVPIGEWSDEPCAVAPVGGDEITVRIEWINPSTAFPRLGWFFDPELMTISTSHPDADTVVVNYQYIEVTFHDMKAGLVQDWFIRLQFTAGSVKDDMRGRLMYKRPTDPEFIIAQGFWRKSGKPATDENGVFDVWGLWPIGMTYRF